MDKKLTLYDVDGNAQYQTIATSTSSSQSAAITTDRILVISATAHFIAFGTNPTADATGFIVPPNTPMQLVITRGHKVAARTHSGNGHITVLELS
jgi:hypothetical protein